MDSLFYDMIYKRKSFHLFRNIGEELISDTELDEIKSVYQSFSALNPKIKTAIRIIPGETTSCRRGEQYCILFYSEKKDGYLQNTGYLGEKLELYLVSHNIGTLWFGIGKPDVESFEGMDFVIMIAIHKIDDVTKFRKDMYKSKRKPVEEIWEGKQIAGVTDIVRFAPSACNTQPWFVRNDGELSVYRYKKPGKRGIMPADKVSYYNQIDIGIFLCFLDVCLTHHDIRFVKKLFHDDGEDEELILNAVYHLECIVE